MHAIHAIEQWLLYTSAITILQLVHPCLIYLVDACTTGKRWPGKCRKGLQEFFIKPKMHAPGLVTLMHCRKQFKMSHMLNQDHDCIMYIDPQGSKDYKNIFAPWKSIWKLICHPCSVSLLVRPCGIFYNPAVIKESCVCISAIFVLQGFIRLVCAGQWVGWDNHRWIWYWILACMHLVLFLALRS